MPWLAFPRLQPTGRTISVVDGRSAVVAPWPASLEKLQEGGSGAMNWRAWGFGHTGSAGHIQQKLVLVFGAAVSR